MTTKARSEQKWAEKFRQDEVREDAKPLKASDVFAQHMASARAGLAALKPAMEKHAKEAAGPKGLGGHHWGYAGDMGAAYNRLNEASAHLNNHPEKDDRSARLSSPSATAHSEYRARAKDVGAKAANVAKGLDRMEHEAAINPHGADWSHVGSAAHAVDKIREAHQALGGSGDWDEAKHPRDENGKFT